ncbi:hypothetical protein [Burkholderia gladioli]|uniref:hypothetical protein n=1 Tax=Burkholderia gladioli TaxID=28095 RepID=UPI001640320E|nr:hypothetical protein [Burkholderia gladioli]
MDVERVRYIGWMDQNRDLAQKLGEAIWAFALVERATYRYMKKLSSDTLDILMADQSIPVRIRVIKQLIARADGPESMKQLAYRCIKTVSQLAEERNLFAHNPFHTWIDFDASEFVHEVEKVTDPSQVKSLDEMEAFTQKSLTLAEEFEDALAHLTYRRNAPRA